jgi:hypothetical protein
VRPPASLRIIQAVRILAAASGHRATKIGEIQADRRRNGSWSAASVRQDRKARQHLAFFADGDGTNAPPRGSPREGQINQRIFR